MSVYTDLGWPAEERDGRVELVTGTTIDALEVPRAAGILAASWWCYTQGYADVIRGVPSLPDPRHALAVIAAGDSHFFIVRSGECPWQEHDPATIAATVSTGVPVIRWHSRGNRIPAPPVPADDGDPGGVQPVWAHLPDRSIRLPGPAILLRLLATAAAMTRLGPHACAERRRPGHSSPRRGTGFPAHRDSYVNLSRSLSVPPGIVGRLATRRRHCVLVL